MVARPPAFVLEIRSFGDGRMYLTYVGESGSTGRSVSDPSQPHLVYTGLLVHESQSISMNGEFSALCRRHFGARLGDQGAPTEIRPVDVYQGLGYFASWPQLKRIELIQDCLSIMVRRETPVIVAYVDKHAFAQARANGDSADALGDSPAESIISRFLFALNMFVDELNMSLLNEQQLMEAQWPVANFALVVATQGQSVEPIFMSDYLKSEDGQDSTAVLNNFCFVGPDQSACTQLANMCAYFARRWLQNPTHPQPYFNALQENKVIQVIYPVHL